MVRTVFIQDIGKCMRMLRLFERFEKAKEQIIWFLAQGVSIKNLENIAL